MMTQNLPADPTDSVERAKARAAGRRRRRLAGLVVLAVVAVVVPVVLSGRLATRPTASAPLTCPDVYVGPAPWVPEGPRGVDGKSHLVPPQPPRHALVCAYSGRNMDVQLNWDLSGSREITAGLDRLAADLTLVPPRPEVSGGCTLMGGPQVNYLLGLTYDTGTLWVSVTDEPNHCVATANGRFTARSIGPGLTAAYTSGTWGPPPPPASEYPCHSQPIGRLGQEASLVPPGATSALICPTPVTLDHSSVPIPDADLNGLIDALNRLPTEPTASACYKMDKPPPSPREYELLFRYPAGPAVHVRITTGCQPSITNGSLDVTDATPVIDRVERLYTTG